MSSNDGEPVRSPALKKKLKIALEKYPEIIEINEDNIADFQIKIKGYADPLFVTIQTQVNKMAEIGYYEVFVLVGSNNIMTMKTQVPFIHSGKSVEIALESALNSFKSFAKI